MAPVNYASKQGVQFEKRVAILLWNCEIAQRASTCHGPCRQEVGLRATCIYRPNIHLWAPDPAPAACAIFTNQVGMRGRECVRNATPIHADRYTPNRTTDAEKHVCDLAKCLKSILKGVPYRLLMSIRVQVNGTCSEQIHYPHTEAFTGK